VGGWSRARSKKRNLIVNRVARGTHVISKFIDIHGTKVGDKVRKAGGSGERRMAEEDILSQIARGHVSRGRFIIG